MDGFVDIHSHILWGLDDGAKDFDMSVAMLRIAAESGTTDIVATPHSDLQYQFQPDQIEKKIAALREAVGACSRCRGLQGRSRFPRSPMTRLRAGSQRTGARWC